MSVEACEPRQLFAVEGLYVVTNADDSGAGSLREAITLANAHVNASAGSDRIAINITGAGADRKIELASPLPAITEAVQLGLQYVPANPALGLSETGAPPSAPLIELDGSAAGATTNGLVISASDSYIFGVAINRFAQNGILVGGNFNAVGESVYIGTDLAGTAVLGNTGHGVAINGSSNTVTLAKIVHNGGDGIAVLSGASNVVFGTATGTIHSNTGQAIDLGTDGATDNDAGDVDGGPNDLQNKPVLTSASFAGGAVTVSGTINTTPDTLVSLDFFANPVAKREGRQFLTENTGTSPLVETDAAGNASFTFTLVGAPVGGVFGTVSAGSFITATATTFDVATNTSEFSNPVGAAPVWLGAGSAAAWDPETKTLDVTGAATIVADPGTDAPLITANGPAAVLTIDPTSATQVNVGSLTLEGGASATVTATGPGRVLVVGPAGLSITGGSALDLTDNDMVVKGATLAGIQALITAGYNNGTWDGGGINSASAANDPNFDTALGYADNGELGLASFSGVTLSGNEILVKYTYYGDADLTGVVDTDDFQLFLAGYQDNTLPRTWLYGDFDYSGVIDTDDFQVFLYGYQNQGGPL